MANIEMNGAPDRTTVGTVGDICTNLLNGAKYKLVSISNITGHKTTDCFYDWRLLDEDESGNHADAAISPTINVTEIDGGHRVSVTDVNGEQSFDVMNGLKGDKGDTGEQGPQGLKGDKGDTGEQGPQGSAGKDGYTPVKGTDYFTEEDKTELIDELEQRLQEQTP